MADDELDLDVKEKGGKGKLILLIVAVLLLVGIAVGVTLFFTGALGGDKTGDSAAKVEDKPEFESKVTLYMPLAPEFVVNFEDTSIVSYMQIEMQIMAREQRALDAVSQHMPVIRNNILLLLSTQKYEEINTAQGKEILREKVLASIQQVLDEESANHNTDKKEGESEEGGEPAGSPKVEAVYFTSLIMQ